MKPASFFRSLLLVTALTPVAALADDARVSLDWEGRYEGLLPCASCPGIETVLLLDEDGTYQLNETYLGDEGELFTQEGDFSWNEDGDTITLTDDEMRSFLVGEGRLVPLNSDGLPSESGEVLVQTIVPATADDLPPPPTREEALAEGAMFIGDGANLKVLPNTLMTSVMEDTEEHHLVFDGVMNFEFPTEGGHKSLTATFDINCTKNTYAMPAVAYFTLDDARGEKIEEATDNGENWLDLILDGESDVAPITQAAQAFCN